MATVVITAVSDQPDWVLTSVGVSQRITDIATNEFHLAVYGVVPGHSNLPATFHVSTSDGVSDLNIRSTTAVEVEAEIRAHFQGKLDDAADKPVDPDTTPSHLKAVDPP